MATETSRAARRPGRRRWVLSAVGALVAAVAAAALAAPAVAAEPTGDFAVFKQCPRFTAGVEECLYGETLSGSVTINKQTLALNEDKKHPIILQGGLTVNEATEEETFVGALNGETLSKSPQRVPGGLAGIVKCNEIKGEGWAEKAARFACQLVLEDALTGLTATTELARPASEIKISTRNLEDKEGVALGLPVKVHLENPFLGSECYVGSSAHPIDLELTDGTTKPNPPNRPIRGKAGFVKFKDEFAFTEIVENTLVSNEFSAPEATGCGGIFSFLIDPLIDSKVGLPAPDGVNTAIEDNALEQAPAAAVVASEK